MCIQIDFNKLRFSFWLPDFLEFQSQLKIRKATIIRVFHLKLHQRQTPSLYLILSVCHFLK